MALLRADPFGPMTWAGQVVGSEDAFAFAVHTGLSTLKTAHYAHVDSEITSTLSRNELIALDKRAKMGMSQRSRCSKITNSSKYLSEHMVRRQKNSDAVCP
jgi:hypothetical protein